MPSVSRERPLRLVGLLLWAILMAAVVLLTNLHYDLNDDMVLVRSFAGCVGGVLESYNIYTHALLGWALHGLSVRFPTVAWFSVYQLALLSVSAYAGILAVLKLCVRAFGSLFAGAILSVLFQAALCFSFYSGITGTLTAAVAGLSAVLLLSVPESASPPRALLRQALPSLGLLTLGYLLRPVAALPSICFWLGTLVCRTLMAPTPNAVTSRKGGEMWRAPLTLLGTALLLWGVLWGVQALADRLSGEGAYVEWQDATTAAIDYYQIGGADQTALQAVGWTEKERQLVMDWYFMDGDMDTAAFRFIGNLPQKRTLADAWQLIVALFTRNRAVPKALAVLNGFCIGAFLLSLRSRTQRLWRLLSPMGCLGAATLLLLYLAWRGRLPMRVAMTILLPACAMGLWLFIESLAAVLKPRDGNVVSHAGQAKPPLSARLHQPLAFLLAIGCVAALLTLAKTSITGVYQPIATFQQGEPTRYTRLEQYALDHPQLLLIAENRFGLERRLFPDWADGKATNLLYAWGGWNNHSEGYRALLSRFGFTDGQFLITDFFSDSVRLVSDQPTPSDVFLAYLAERAGGPVAWEITETGDGYYLFSLRRS